MTDDLPTVSQAKQEIGWPLDFAHGFSSPNYVYIPELEGSWGLLNFQLMAETDETVGAMLWVLITTLAQLQWNHVPMVNGKAVAQDDPDYDEAVKAANFADECLDDMSHTWAEHLEEALTMFWAGFAPCEIVLRRRSTSEGSKYDDGKWGYHRLPLRDQNSVTRWEDDKRDNIVKMVQTTLGGGTVEIPTWKILHYRTSTVLGNPWGRSMLKNAYKIWRLKLRLQDAEAIGVERELCGLPTILVPGDTLDQAQETSNGQPTAAAVAATSKINAAIAAVTKMRFNNNGGLILPSDVYEDSDGKPGTMRKWEFKLTTSAGQRTIDPRVAIRDHDRAMARTILMQFLHLGDRAGGSYALSNDQSVMALRALNWIGEKIANEYRKKALRLLWLVNALPMKYLPGFEASAIAQETMDQLGLFLQRVADAEPLFQEDPAMRNAVFRQAGLASPRRKVKDQPAKPAPDPAKPADPAAKPAKSAAKAPIRVRS